VETKKEHFALEKDNGRKNAINGTE